MISDKPIIIRYAKVQGSLWFSLHDVVEFLRYKKAISTNRNIDYFFRKEMAKKMVIGNNHFNYNCMLAVKPFDEFVNWVHFPLFYNICLKSEKDKIKSTQIIQAIDDFNMYQAKQYYPDIFECLEEVSLQETYAFQILPAPSI